MINQLINMLFMKYVGRFIEGSIRKNSIKAVKGYVQTVGLVRLSFLFAMQVSIATSILVAGLILMAVGIFDLFPLDPRMAAIASFVGGAILFVGSGIGLYLSFSEKRWLKVSKSYELMEAVTAPWPGMMPPNPFDIINAQPEKSPKVEKAPGKAANNENKFSKSAARSRDVESQSDRVDYPAASLAAEGV
jgi:hypothetical protein